MTRDTQINTFDGSKENNALIYFWFSVHEKKAMPSRKYQHKKLRIGVSNRRHHSDKIFIGSNYMKLDAACEATAGVGKP